MEPLEIFCRFFRDAAFFEDEDGQAALSPGGGVAVAGACPAICTSPEPVITGSGGLAFEAAHFARLVAEGRPESPLLPWAETLAIMGTLDEIRAQVGVRFPGEA